MINVPKITRINTENHPATELTKLEYAAITIAAGIAAEGSRCDFQIASDAVEIARQILTSLAPVETESQASNHTQKGANSSK